MGFYRIFLWHAQAASHDIIQWITTAVNAEPLDFDSEQFICITPPIVLNSGLKFKWSEAKATIGHHWY